MIYLLQMMFLPYHRFVRYYNLIKEHQDEEKEENFTSTNKDFLKYDGTFLFPPQCEITFRAQNVKYKR